MGGAGARNHCLRRRAALVDAGAADVLAFDDSDGVARLRHGPGKRASSLSSTDNKKVVGLGR